MTTHPHRQNVSTLLTYFQELKCFDLLFFSRKSVPEMKFVFIYGFITQSEIFQVFISFNFDQLQVNS